MSELATFFNIAHDLFCIVDNKGFYKRVNPAFFHLLAYPEAELMRHPFTYFIHPEDVAQTLREYEEVTQGKHNKVVSNRFRGNDGRYYWISWSTIVQDEQGLFYSAGQNITEHKRLEEAILKEQQVSQQRLVKAVISTQERERTQISRELHDNVNQILTTVKLYMELCRADPQKGENMLDKALGLQLSAINEIRSLSKRLSAPSLGNIKLCDSVRDLIDSYKEANANHINLDIECIEDLEVPQEVHLSVYRILQEQLTNISKHAEAGEIHIAFDFEEGKLTMTVRDNGKGFSLSAKNSGIGLYNMKTRAEDVGGSLSIMSTLGAGTELQLTIPLLDEKHPTI